MIAAMSGADSAGEARPVDIAAVRPIGQRLQVSLNLIKFWLAGQTSRHTCGCPPPTLPRASRKTSGPAGGSGWIIDWHDAERYAITHSDLLSSFPHNRV